VNKRAFLTTTDFSEGGASKQNDYTSQGTRFIIKEEKLYFVDRKPVQEMWKTANNAHFEVGTEELDKYLCTMIKTENDLEQQVDLFSEAVQSACWRTFQNTTTRKKNNKKSVPWWLGSFILMWKRVNACIRLYQITRNDEKLKESRKQKYIEAKRKY